MAETIALSPELGAELIEYENLLDDDVVRTCLEALKWRGVLLIRGAHLDDDAQLAFSRKLGQVLAPGGQEITTVTLDPAKNKLAQYLRGAFNWHIDDTTSAVPAKATMLTARRLAMVGGGTEFANTYAAYENLPEHERKRYEGLRVVHSFEAAQLKVTPDPSEKELASWRRVPSYDCSLVWQRRDGRRSLVIGATADHIVGMEPIESRALLDDLLAWSTQERFCYSHDWAEGDAVIWNNTGMLHRALPYDPKSQRTMQRTTIAGDEAWG
jgi:alpha-ketoglutarate-dependent taurine dioxygenase